MDLRDVNRDKPMGREANLAVVKWGWHPLEGDMFFMDSLRVAASLALDGYPAPRTRRKLPLVTNTYPGNIFFDDGEYFRGTF